MSYILEALRKSEQLRQRGAAPTLNTPQIEAVAAKQPEYWIYGLIAAALVGAGIAIGWLQQPKSEVAEPVSAPAVPNPPERRSAQPRRLSAAAHPMQAAAPSTAVRRVAPHESTKQARLATRPTAHAATHRQAVAARAQSEARSSAVAARAESPRRGTEQAAAPTREAKVLNLRELPIGIREEMPTLQIALHLYSTRPGHSYVDINGQMLQEGAYAAPGVKLEQITPDGVILSYKGYRFRQRVQ